MIVKKSVCKGRRSNAHNGGIAGAAAPVVCKERCAVDRVDGSGEIGGNVPPVYIALFIRNMLIGKRTMLDANAGIYLLIMILCII